LDNLPHKYFNDTKPENRRKTPPRKSASKQGHTHRADGPSDDAPETDPFLKPGMLQINKPGNLPCEGVVSNRKSIR